GLLHRNKLALKILSKPKYFLIDKKQAILQKQNPV
ncbi:MAG: hypothetical protein ACI81T_000779, partial [Bacteroidia bacterium]